jgi:VWFA-related protein
MSTQRRSIPLRNSLALAILGLSGVGAAMSQQTPTPGSPFGEEIDVRIVNVEVVVTDGKGERVSGLSAADFTLSVDGEPVTVEYFSEIRDGRSQATSPAPTAADAAPPVGGAARVPGAQPPAAASAGTNYLVFVDDYFALAPQRDPVLTALSSSLGQLRPEDRMAIVAFDGGRLVQLSGWSGSRRELAAAFDRALSRKTRGFDRAVERRSFNRNEEFRSQGVGQNRPLDLNARGGDLNEEQRAYGETLISQVQASAAAAVSAMRAYAAPTGRKVLLLLVGGWPYSARSIVTNGGGLPRQDLPEGDKVLAPLADTANLLGYTIYPVDVPGAQTAASDAEAMRPADAISVYDSGGATNSGGGGGSASGTGSGGGVQPLSEQENEASLRFLAKQTGGRPILDADRAVALATASDDTRTFYWLGFVPSWRGDDRAHRLKVDVKRPGLSVRARSGFLDLSRQAEVSMRLESALLLGTFPGALQMPIKVGEPKRGRRGQIELPITLGLPVDLMTVVPVGGKHAAKLELRFAASDDKGATSQIPVVPVTLTSATPPRPGGFVRYETTVTLRGPANHLVVAAYDLASDRVATAEVDLAMP